MKPNTKTLALSSIMGLALLTPALANAERIYFLVGTRHIYRIGPTSDLDLAQREEIEKTYADGVAADQDTFQKNVAGGADKDKESELLNADLDRLAVDRDKALGAIFEQRDDLRIRHPELKIDGDGPYQVMGINFHMRSNVEVFDSFVVLPPWPGYVVVGAPYGGWVFGQVYAPGVFFNLYLGWHASWGGGRFYGGFYGHHGYVEFHPRGFVDRQFVGGGNAGFHGVYGRPGVHGAYGQPGLHGLGTRYGAGGGYAGHPGYGAPRFSGRVGRPEGPGHVGGYGHVSSPVAHNSGYGHTSPGSSFSKSSYHSSGSPRPGHPGGGPTKKGH